MRAVHCTELKGADALTVVELPEPQAGNGVLIDVEAAGVGFADMLMTQGRYQVRPTPPFIPGMEAAGTVRSAPADSGFKPGDRVCGSVTGAFAEVAVGGAGGLFHLPAALSFAEGAAFTVNYQTAMFALGERARFEKGESLLVLGASGGTGTSAIQVARGMGASQIIGVVSTEAKAKIAREAGADDAVLISDGWKDEVKEKTGGRGVDVVYDPVGADLFLDGVRSLATNGRLLVIGFAGGSIPEVKINRLLLNNVSLVGAAWGEAVRRDPTLPKKVHERLLPLIDGDFIHPPIGAVYDMDHIADGFRLLGDRKATGKVVLQVR